MSAKRLRDLKLCGLALLVMTGFAWLHLAATDLPWLWRLEVSALDARVRWRGPQAPGPETVIVMIDDQTLSDLGRWPIPRRKMAELVTALHRAGARAIGIDVLFADPEPPEGVDAKARTESAGDAALARAIAAAGNVALPFTFKFGRTVDDAKKPYLTRAAYVQLHKSGAYQPLSLKPTEVLTPVAMLAEAATLGHMLVAYDIDGEPRYEYPVLEYDVDFYPSMAMRIAQVYLGVPWAEVSVELGRSVAIGPVVVPTDAQTRMLVNYLGPARTFPAYSLSQVLSGAVPGSVFRDRIVLVGADALGTRDSFETPFTAVMPGVERLATIIDSILHERHLRRPATAPWIEIGFMLAAALAMGLAMSRLSLFAASLCAAAAAAAIAVSGQIALERYGVWLLSAVPIVATLLTFAALLFYRYVLLDKERRHIRSVFKRYLAPHMVDRVVSNQKLPELGGELRDLTILFCDLRGFTALSERLDAADLTRVANQFFAIATEAILEHGGTIDKYIGDAIMALWNAPAEQPDHAALACRAALRILEQLDKFNESLSLDDDAPRLDVGIGINTGPCTVGNFGSSRRFDYSAIGDAVNVAARLEGETKSYGVSVLVGPETAARATGFATLPIDRIRPRGRAEALEIYVLAGDETLTGSASYREFRSKHLELRAAWMARDEDAVRRLADELRESPPPGLRAMYDGFVTRASRHASPPDAVASEHTVIDE